jgi:hypothetical protein
MVEIMFTDPAHVAAIWPSIADYADKAIERQQPRLFEASFYREMCEQGKALLLTAHKNDRLIGFIVLEERQFPLAKVAFICLCGGIEGRAWLHAMERAIVEIARLNQCQYVMGTGRKGWARAMPDYALEHASFFKKVA